MSTDLKPSDVLYNAFRCLRGWDQLLDAGSSDRPGPLGYKLGRMLSSVLLALGEDDAIAVGGEITDNGSGYATVVHTTGLIDVRLDGMLTRNTGQFTIAVLSWKDVRGLTVSADHNYYLSTNSMYERYHQMSFSVVLPHATSLFKTHDVRDMALVGEEAMFQAFRLLRDNRQGRRRPTG